MKMTAIIARYLLGLIFTVFGLNGFLSFIHQPPPPGKSARDSVSGLRQRIALCRVLLRDSVARWAAVAFGLLRAACADAVGGGALQHSCVPSDPCADEHCSRSGGLRAMCAGFPSVPRKFQRHLQCEAFDVGRKSLCGIRSGLSPTRR